MADLTSTANLKGWLGITGTTDDTLLARLVSSASNFFLQEVGRDDVFSAVNTWTDTRDGTGGQKLILRNYPIVSLDSLVIDTTVIPQSVNRSAGWLLNKNVGEILLIGYRFCEGFQNVVAGYHAGYSSVPKDIEQAVIELASLRYQERKHIGEVSKIVGTATVSFSQKDMSDDIRDTVSKYQQKCPVG